MEIRNEKVLSLDRSMSRKNYFLLPSPSPSPSRTHQKQQLRLNLERKRMRARLRVPSTNWESWVNFDQQFKGIERCRTVAITGQSHLFIRSYSIGMHAGRQRSEAKRRKLREGNRGEGEDQLWNDG